MPARVYSFSGVVAAKLPFVPFSLIQKISHRGLEGDDATDCSVVSGGTMRGPRVFIYADCELHREEVFTASWSSFIELTFRRT